jgi:hypothetical protein
MCYSDAADQGATVRQLTTPPTANLHMQREDISKLSGLPLTARSSPGAHRQAQIFKSQLKIHLIFSSANFNFCFYVPAR